ncbi:Receptor-like serine/threonine-protein kinase SD1-7, partial [Mucuna pruriens]
MNPKTQKFQILGWNLYQIPTGFGYMSPKYAIEGIFSTKSNVYSFGVLLLEIVSGRRNISFYDSDGPLNLIGYVCILSHIECIHIGLLCVEHYANSRPTMSDIISMLTNKSTIVSLPQRPAFYVQRDIVDEKLSSKELCPASTIEITALEIESRKV